MSHFLSMKSVCVMLLQNLLLYCSRELLLNQNYLRVLPYELGKLFQLQVLGLQGNPLSKDVMTLYGNGEPAGTNKLLTYMLDNLQGKWERFYLWSELLKTLEFLLSKFICVFSIILLKWIKWTYTIYVYLVVIIININTERTECAK